MKVLIRQPIHEEGLSQLERDIKVNKGIDIVLYPEGYILNEKVLADACNTAKENKIMIITSYKDVIGAKAVGMKGILVRSTPTDSIEYYSTDLSGVKEIIV